MLLGDRYYDSYWLLVELRQRKVDFVFKLRRTSSITEFFAEDLGENDMKIWIPKVAKPKRMSQEEYKRLPDRVVASLTSAVR